MDYKDWLILKILKEENSLTKVAQRLFISQPSLTYRLQRLEQELDVKIINRYSNGVTFTESGEFLVKYAEEMLERQERMTRELRAITAVEQGLLKIGFSSVVAKYKMAGLLKIYKERFPYMEIKIQTASSTLKLPELVRSGQIDMAIIRGDSQAWTQGKKLLDEEPMCLVCSRKIALASLPHTPWIQYEAGRITHSKEQKELWWSEKMQCPLPQIITVDSIDACLQMVRCGLGWSIMPKIHLAEYRDLYIAPIIWSSGQTMTWQTTMIYRDEILQQPEYINFIEYILQKYK